MRATARALIDGCASRSLRSTSPGSWSWEHVHALDAGGGHRIVDGEQDEHVVASAENAAAQLPKVGAQLNPDRAVPDPLAALVPARVLAHAPLRRDARGLGRRDAAEA